LSKYYLDEVNFAPLKRLKDMRLGSDDEGFYNDNIINPFTLGANAKDADNNVNVNAKTLLETVVLTNLRGLN
jgi:hypothetical protein